MGMFVLEVAPNHSAVWKGAAEKPRVTGEVWGQLPYGKLSKERLELFFLEVPSVNSFVLTGDVGTGPVSGITLSPPVRFIAV